MLYNQICLDCKYEFTHEAPMSEGPKRECPLCGGNAQRVYDTAPVVHNLGLSPVHPRKLRGRGGQLK